MKRNLWHCIALLFTLTLAVFGLTGALSAQAADLTWSLPTDLSATGRDAYEQQIALSADGSRAIAVWYRYNDNYNAIIQTASATISGKTATWGPVADLSATGQDAAAPQIGLSADGSRATAVWKRSNGSVNIIQTASATISGNTATWGAVADLSATGRNADVPQIGLSADGTKATAVWSRFNGSNQIVQTASATVSGNTTTWGTVADLTATGLSANAPQLGLSADGSRATAVWLRSNGSNNIIQAASALISGNTATWGTVADLSATGRNASAPQLGLSTDGSRATAVWYRNDGSNTIIQTASATVSGNTASWGTVFDLSATGQNANGPQLGLSADGSRAAAVWYRFNGSNWFV
jgi:alkylated DNA nucleotide flippase Atl1